MKLTEKEWKHKLTKEQYRVLREAGTERPGSGKYDKHFEEGKYVCAGCGAPLFSSEDKYDAHCGWPSFTATDKEAKIEKKLDFKLVMPRMEVLCEKCGGHLGHVFPDGPGFKPRYCINSAALDFKKKRDT